MYDEFDDDGEERWFATKNGTYDKYRREHENSVADAYDRMVVLPMMR
jgi:hypothetical protein